MQTTQTRPRIAAVAQPAEPGSAEVAIRLGYLDWKGWAKAIVSIRATPRQVALGVALGSFIAFTPFIGLQMLLAALFATLVGASRKAAMLTVWISNPLTMGPIFLLTYQIGLVLCSPNTATAGVSAQVGAVAHPDAATATPAMTLGALIDSGWTVVTPMLLGGAVIGLLAAFVGYTLARRGVAAYQAIHAVKQNTRD